MANIYKEITKLYTKGGYTSRYLGDILIAFAICLIVFVIFSYFQVMNNVQPIIDDWTNQRCNPSVIPFAGIINKPSNQSAFDFTASNFENCTQSILGEITQYAFEPFYYLMSVITTTFKDLADSMNSIRAMFDKMRDSIKGVGEDIFSRNLNVLLPIVSMFAYLKSIIGKIQATFVSAIYTAFGGFITLESFFMFCYELIINVMWVIVGVIISCFAIGWLFPPVLTTGLFFAAFLAVILIPVTVMIVIMNDIFDSAGLSHPPAIPGYCFDENTKIQMKNKNYKKIIDIELGDVLWDGSIVTALMKSSSRNQDMFKINGITVSGSHLIYDPVKGPIRIKEHPDSEYLDDYNKSFIYCLGTNTKTIKINNMIFADWDEIDEEDMNDIRYNCDFLPFDFNKQDIHNYLDGGVHPDTLIELEDGRSVKISDIDVNDVLYTGDYVTGLVKIKTDDIQEFCSIEINNEEILKCNKNCEIIYNNLGSDLEINFELIKPPKLSYHLITSSGYFKVNDLLVGDYNKCIDKYLKTNLENTNDNI